MGGGQGGVPEPPFLGSLGVCPTARIQHRCTSLKLRAVLGGRRAVPLLHSELPRCFTLYWLPSGAGGPTRTAPSWPVSGGGSPGLQPYHFHLAICTHLVQRLLHTELMGSGEP